MKIKELIKVLQKLEDPDLAEIEFYIDGDDETRYDVKSISAFGISTDIIFTLHQVDNPIMKPASFKRQHKKMIEKVEKEIKREQGI